MRIKYYSILFKIFSLLILFGFNIFSCRKSSLPIESSPTLSPHNYQKIIVQVMDYDIVHVTHQSGKELVSQNIEKIEIGEKQDTIFHQLAISESIYDSFERLYQIKFDFMVTLDCTKTTVPLTIRYHTKNLSYTDVDTVIELHKYPYPTAEIVIDTSIIFRKYKDSYQDFARNESKYFYHGWNTDCLNEYDPITNEITVHNFYGGGSHITANSDYVFCDVNHKEIKRFNLATQTPDLTLSNFKNINSLTGIAIDNSILWVIWRSDYPYGQRIHAFTLEGVALDSMMYPLEVAYFMAAGDSIIYSKYYTNNPSGNQISRYDLELDSMLSNVLSPAKRLGGMEIYNDTLYYCDVWKNFVGKVSVSNLIPVQ